MSEQIKKEDIQFIDIEGVLKKRLKGKYKFIPGFLFRYLKRKIHQEEINIGLEKFGHLTGLDFLKETLNYIGVDSEVEGMENIDPNRRYVLASNHPLGGLDGVAFIYRIGTEIGEAKAIVNDLLLNFANLKPVFQGVNVYGKFSKSQIKDLDDLYMSDKQILVFPAGLVSRKIKGEITDLPWKKNFLTKAIQYQRDVIPVFIEGQNSKFFYNFANFRKRIGFKFNIELIYLPDEMFNYKGKTIKIKIGKPIPYQTFDKKQKPIKEWVEVVRNEVYKMK